MLFTTKAQGHAAIPQRNISFEENRGQGPGNARFLARGQGYNLVLTPEGNQLVLRHDGHGLSLTSRLVGGSSNPAIRGEEKQAGKVHYLRAGTSVTGIPTYARVRYERVYPGIDLVYYGNQQQLEYDFIVNPGADPNRVAIRFDGAQRVSIDPQGNLVLRANNSEIVQHKPVVYQPIRGSKKHIEGSYRLLTANTVAFEIGAYDHSAVLVIDPILSYATFLGGSNGDDNARAVVTDSAGSIYVTGSTSSTNFLTASPLQGNAGDADSDSGSSDAFVTKLDATGRTVIYSTYLGGIGDDDANAIALDLAGNVIIAGSTSSTDFPTTSGAFRRTCNNASKGCLDAFVAKINPGGSALVYSTYFGGTDDDEARGIAVDSMGNAYITGKTASTDFFTTPGAYSTDRESQGFVTKFSASGVVAYSTYFRTALGPADPKGIAVDSSGNAYITGSTSQAGSSTGADVFITKLNAAGGASIYTQFIRGAKDDVANAVAVDASGNAYIAGQTSSINFTTTANALQPVFGGGPAFRSFDSGVSWSVTSSGITQTSLYALAAGPGAIYAGADDESSGGVFKSTDGATWTNVSTGLADTRIHALAVDPTASAIVYAGSRTLGLFKSTNSGANWSLTPLNNVFVTALAIDPHAPGTIYAGTDANGIYKSTDGGSSWAAINDGFVTSSVRSIAIDPTSPAVYAATGSGVYKTTDGGGRWFPASSGLFDPNINVVVVDPRNPNVVYAATNSVGIFRSVNGGALWVASNSGLTSSNLRLSVSALAIDPISGTLYAAIGESNASRVFRGGNGSPWVATSLSTARLTALAVVPNNIVYAATIGGADAFVAKWNPSGAMVYSTYIGGFRDDAANAIAIDAGGNAYVAGDTSSTNFPVISATQPSFGGGSDVVTDAFAAKLNASGSGLVYATYIGGSNNDFGEGIAVDSANNAYVVGVTGSADFPTVAALIPGRPGLLDAFVVKIADSTSISYSIPIRGGQSVVSQGVPANVSIGYVRIQPNSGSAAPSGLAIFGFRQNNVLVSEAAVPASPLVGRGRIYAEIDGGVNTGIAIANPNGVPVDLTFYFTDRNGQVFRQGVTTIGANAQIAAFLNQSPFNGGTSVFGTFTFSASPLPVSVIALRGLTNERGEFLITTLPVADLSIAAVSDAILFPHFADGGGWTTQILLVNTSDAAMSGSIQFSNSLTQDYSVPGGSAVKIVTPGIASSLVTGSVRVVPAAGSKTPTGVAVFSFKNAGVTVTEAGVPALRAGIAFRLYAESSGASGQVGSIQSGVAIANPSNNTVSVTFEVTTLSGVTTGLTGSLSIRGNSQTAVFLGEIPGLAALPNPFQGVLRVSTSSPEGIAVVGLRSRYNERGDFLITTTQPTNEATPIATSEQFFPHVADGGGYTTQFILFGSTDQPSAGSLRFFTQSGQALNLAVR